MPSPSRLRACPLPANQNRRNPGRPGFGWERANLCTKRVCGFDPARQARSWSREHFCQERIRPARKLRALSLTTRRPSDERSNPGSRLVLAPRELAVLDAEPADRHAPAALRIIERPLESDRRRCQWRTAAIAAERRLGFGCALLAA